MLHLAGEAPERQESADIEAAGEKLAGMRPLAVDAPSSQPAPRSRWRGWSWGVPSLGRAAKPVLACAAVALVFLLAAGVLLALIRTARKEDPPCGPGRVLVQGTLCCPASGAAAGRRLQHGSSSKRQDCLKVVTARAVHPAAEMRVASEGRGSEDLSASLQPQDSLQSSSGTSPSRRPPWQFQAGAMTTAFDQQVRPAPIPAPQGSLDLFGDFSEPLVAHGTQSIDQDSYDPQVAAYYQQTLAKSSSQSSLGSQSAASREDVLGARVAGSRGDEGAAERVGSQNLIRYTVYDAIDSDDEEVRFNALSSQASNDHGYSGQHYRDDDSSDSYNDLAGSLQVANKEDERTPNVRVKGIIEQGPADSDRESQAAADDGSSAERADMRSPAPGVVRKASTRLTGAFGAEPGSPEKPAATPIRQPGLLLDSPDVAGNFRLQVQPVPLYSPGSQTSRSSIDSSRSSLGSYELNTLQKMSKQMHAESAQLPPTPQGQDTANMNGQAPALLSLAARRGVKSVYVARKKSFSGREDRKTSHQHTEDIQEDVETIAASPFKFHNDPGVPKHRYAASIAQSGQEANGFLEDQQSAHWSFESPNAASKDEQVPNKSVDAPVIQASNTGQKFVAPRGGNTHS